MKLHVEDARKQVGPAEMQLEWVEEQLSAILAECAVSTTRESAEDGTSDNLAFGNTITPLLWRLWDVESTHKLFIEAGEDVRG